MTTGSEGTRVIIPERPVDRRAVRLAFCLAHDLREPQLSQVYDSLRRAIYGLPAGCIDATDLLHELADLLGKPDPSET